MVKGYFGKLEFGFGFVYDEVSGKSNFSVVVDCKVLNGGNDDRVCWWG